MWYFNLKNLFAKSVFKGFKYLRFFRCSWTSRNVQLVALILKTPWFALYKVVKPKYDKNKEVVYNEKILDEMRSVNIYFTDGAYYRNLYLGSINTAYKLFKKGLQYFEGISIDSKIASIGYCKKEQKWYGWSHRAMLGFGVGSSVKVGDCAFKPGNLRDAFLEVCNWYKDKRIIVSTHDDGIYTRKAGDESIKNDFSLNWVLEPGTEPENLNGHGEWTAENFSDAKQMAKDFAEDVS